MAALTGCSTMGKALNPYEDNFKCSKKAPFGQCADTPEVYSQVVPSYKPEPRGTIGADSASAACPDCELKAGAAPAAQPSIGVTEGESAYSEASLKKAAKLLKDPVTPVIIPPVAMRIWIAPRRSSDDVLDMGQYVFMIVEKPRFALGDYLNAQPED